MPGILLVGHNHYGYLFSIKRGFEALGRQVTINEHENTCVSKINRRNPVRRWTAKRKIDEINRTILTVCKATKPDLTLIINGEAVLLPTVQELRKVAPVCVWVVDGVENIRLPTEWLSHYDHAFLFEPSDISFVEGATYLCYGADESIYCDLGTPPDIDVSFVGSPHDNRLPILEDVADYCENNDIDFGIFGPFSKFRKWRYKEKYCKRYPAVCRSIRVNRRLTPDEVNGIYNRSRVNLNLHHTQSRLGVNPRVFEVLAAGGVLLTDWKPQLQHVLDMENDFASYRSTEELCHLLKDLLADTDRREKLSQTGRQAVLNAHCFRHRCKQILSQFSI